MAFTSSIKGKMQGNPVQHNLPEAYKTEWVWGVWDGTSVTTGAIDLECDNVLYCSAFDAEAIEAVQIQLDTDGSGAQAGSVRLDFTSGSSGRFMALVMHRR